MISIVVSNFNTLEKLKLFLECCMVQKFKKFEVIVSDDGSTDGSLIFLDEFIKTNEGIIDIKYITHEHTRYNLSRVRNDGANISKYSNVWFTDSDCLFDSDYLQIMNDLILEYPDALLGGKRQRIDSCNQYLINSEIIKNDFNKIKELSRQQREPGDYNDDYSGYIGRGVVLIGCNMMCPKHIIVEVNGFDEDYDGYAGEDTDFLLRLTKARKYKFAVCGYLVVYHMEHERVEGNPEGGTKLFNKKQFDSSIIRNTERNIFY